MSGSDSVYAEDGVDFGKEREVVAVFEKLFESTKKFTRDLESYGITPPEGIGYFSDGIMLNPSKLSGQGDILLVYGMDGAGTKPLAHLAYLMSERSGEDTEISRRARACVGVDTVAMVVNDLLCGGARPMHILDYVAWEDPDPEIASDLAQGMYLGARQAGATVVGGENASLSEMINGYDCCAAGSGIVLIPYYLEHSLSGERIEVGDCVVGIGSSGVHCNGISTARKKLLNVPEFGWNGRYRLDEIVPEFGQTAAEEILTPTIIYKEPVLDGVLSDEDFNVKAISNITGEGIHNLGRSLEAGEGVGAEIDVSGEDKLRPQAVFRVIQREGRIPNREMWEDYNMGIGMQMIVPREQAQTVVERLEEYEVGGEPIRASVIGRIMEDEQQRIRLKTDKFETEY